MYGNYCYVRQFRKDLNLIGLLRTQNNKIKLYMKHFEIMKHFMIFFVSSICLIWNAFVQIVLVVGRLVCSRDRNLVFERIRLRVQGMKFDGIGETFYFLTFSLFHLNFFITSLFLISSSPFSLLSFILV